MNGQSIREDLGLGKTEGLIHRNDLENKDNPDTMESMEAKDRIVMAATRLFSRKGYDATSVNEIAREANVTKALIYYYFKGKEDILDYLVQSLMKNFTSIALDFIHQNIVQMIRDGQLDIEPDRLRFANDEAIRIFLRNADAMYHKILNYSLEYKAVFRILMLESLKNSKHHYDLFHLMAIKGSEDNPIIRTISEADKDFTFTNDMLLFEMFFAYIPFVSFVAYHDDFKELSGRSDEELYDLFIQSFRIIMSSLVSGRDILLKNRIES